MFIKIVNKKMIEPVFFTVLLIGFLNFLASSFYLFWTVMWFDMIMHFLGGFMLSLIVAFIVSQKSISYKNLLKYCIIFSVIGGFLWEIFELSFHITFIHDHNYFSDSGMDMTMDTFGALLAVFYSYYKLNIDK
jgi:hypothetical protein